MDNNLQLENIVVFADHQELKLLEYPKELAANSVNYVKIFFKFTEDWNDEELYKVAIFENMGKYYAIYIDEENQEEDGSFYIPFQVIKAPGFTVSVFASNVKPIIGIDGKITNRDKKIEIRKRITTNIITFPIKISGPLQGIIPEANSKEVNIYEQTNLALQIAREAYTVAYNIQFSLQKINQLLGGDPYALCRIENKIQEILKDVNNKKIAKDEYGIPILTEDGQYTFIEVE